MSEITDEDIAHWLEKYPKAALTQEILKENIESMRRGGMSRSDVKDRLEELQYQVEKRELKSGNAHATKKLLHRVTKSVAHELKLAGKEAGRGLTTNPLVFEDTAKRRARLEAQRRAEAMLAAGEAWRKDGGPEVRFDKGALGGPRMTEKFGTKLTATGMEGGRLINVTEEEPWYEELGKIQCFDLAEDLVVAKPRPELEAWFDEHQDAYLVQTGDTWEHLSGQPGQLVAGEFNTNPWIFMNVKKFRPLLTEEEQYKVTDVGLAILRHYTTRAVSAGGSVYQAVGPGSPGGDLNSVGALTSEFRQKVQMVADHLGTLDDLKNWFNEVTGGKVDLESLEKEFNKIRGRQESKLDDSVLVTFGSEGGSKITLPSTVILDGKVGYGVRIGTLKFQVLKAADVAPSMNQTFT